MTIGSAVFFGSLIIAVAILYAATKDRWNWKKLIKRAILIPVVAALIIGILVWIYIEIQDRPFKQTEFDGIKLGDSREEILFKKGNPDGDYDLFIKDVVSFIKQEGGVEKMTLSIKKKNDEKIVSLGKREIAFSINPETNKPYSESEIRNLLKELVEDERDQTRLYYKNTYVFFKDGKVSAIKRECDKSDYFYVNDIGCGYSLARIEEKLGKAKKMKCSADSLTRVYYFPQYQSAYKLDKDGVKIITVYDKLYENELDMVLKECNPSD
jgi:hypothetical protein